MKHLFKNKYAGILGLLMLLFVVACDYDDDGDVVEVDPIAYVSLYQASPDAPPLNIMVDSRIINTHTFDYTDYTGYLRFFTGERSLSFGPTGASNIVLDTMVTFEEEEVYSVFLAGEYPNIEALVFNDGADGPSSGNAMVRVINLSPDVSDIDLSSEGETDAIFDDQGYKEASEFTELSAERYDFEVRNAAGDEVLLSVPNINLVPGYFYTIVVRGYQTPPSGNNNDLSAQIIVN